MAGIAYVLAARLNPQSNGQYTADLPAPQSQFQTQLADGSYRPGIPGDVYSCQPDGSMQGRPQGTNGPWELLTLVGVSLQFQPLGPNTPLIIFLPQ